jgi:hypothetical protein
MARSRLIQLLLRIDEDLKRELDAYRLSQDLIVSPGVAARQLLRMALAQRMAERRAEPRPMLAPARIIPPHDAPSCQPRRGRETARRDAAHWRTRGPRRPYLCRSSRPADPSLVFNAAQCI